MDGLSAGAGAIAILQAIGAIPTIIDTLRTLIHIDDEIKALTNELTTLQALQDHLKSQVDLLSGTDPRLRVPEPKMMQLARATLAELIDELHRLVTKYNNKKRRRVLFVWDRNKIAQMGERARAARQALMTSMQDLSLALMNTHGKVLLDIHTFTTLMPGMMDGRVQRLEGLINTSKILTPAPATPVSEARVITNVAPARPPPMPRYSEDPFFELLTIGCLTDRDADPSDPHPSTISMQASVYSSSSACPQSCSCHCHLSSALHTPSWLQPVLGSVLLCYSCIPLLGAGPCDQANCVRATSRAKLTYYFPAARVLKRALCFSIEVGGSFGYGAGLHVSVPRVFSSHDEAWETVNFGGPEDLKRVWAKRPGAYSPLDVNEAGMSLLMDATARKNTKAAMFLINTWGLRESKRPCDRSTIMVAREMISLPSGVSSTSELEPLLIIASLSPDGPRTPFSPLHQAIRSGSSLSSLLSSFPPPNLNQRDFLGRTPLIHASRINNLPAVQLLLRAGAGAKLIDARDSLGQTALLAALVGGHIHIALALLNAGCAVRVANDVGRTPLHAIFRTWDSWNPHPDAAEVLARLVQGGDVCARSSYGYTPLHYLVWRARGPVPLVTSVLRMVLDAGADVDTKDKALGAPAVLYAVRARSSAVLKILLERGARLTFVDQSGANILGELATSADLEGLKIIKDAKMSGMNVFLADAKQHTPLGRWRERVRLRKLEDTTISIREETAVFELLVRDIRDRQLQEDVDHLGEILRGMETTNLSQANKGLSQLIQKKTEIRLIQDIGTLRTLRTQLKEGMWEAARETVQEIVEICRGRSKRSPWAEDQYHWRELQVSEWVVTASAGGTT